MPLYVGTHTKDFSRQPLNVKYIGLNSFTFAIGFKPTVDGFGSLEVAIAQGLFYLLNARFKISYLTFDPTNITMQVREHNDYARLDAYLNNVVSGKDKEASVVVHTIKDVPSSIAAVVQVEKPDFSEEFPIYAFLSNKYIQIKKGLT